MERDSNAPGSEPLKALPSDQLPREKLAAQGRAALSDEELIAIFLRTGISGCNVLELAALLKRRAGSLAALATLEAAEITSLCKGIGLAKAATLAAVFELGRRAARESKETLDMRTAQNVYDYFVEDMRYMEQEHMYALLLNQHYHLIRSVEISRGTLSRTLIHPRDVFRDAIRSNAHSFILVHNHPSGDPKPSQADIALTKDIFEAARLLHIFMVDHIIIGAPTEERTRPYYSFKEQSDIFL